jgi:NB-ARC domain
MNFGFMPLDMAWKRVDIARHDSDTSLFMALMYAGEMLTKLTVLAMISGLDDDPDRSSYRELHRLVRADGIGEWCAVLDEVLVGPASQHLSSSARTEQKELTQKLGNESWQFEAATAIDSCIRALDKTREGMPFKVEGRRWFSLFSELRNRTRGHGAFSGKQCTEICPILEKSISLVISNLSLFRREWAYLHRNLSGKYRVTPLSTVSSEFQVFKSSKAVSFKFGDGVYIFFDKPCFVELLLSDAGASDFLLPNGGFNQKRFECVSYLSDTVKPIDAFPYLSPAGDLPASETQGIGRLDVQGATFGNLPPTPHGYIRRHSLEEELREHLLDDRHPVITLVGRGGIGKTSLALQVLHEVSACDHFGAILWFSARDIDLFPSGPKLVRPHLLTENEIAKEFVKLIEPSESGEKGFKPLRYFSEALTKSPIGSPLLLVFDNFETVRSPVDLYSWIDNGIRLPNKVLITTRLREFKGDYPVEVQGMSESESDLLIDSQAEALCIHGLITDLYRKQLFRESDGHPYVIKVLLGEVAKAGKLAKIERIVANKEDILDALFERTYSGLSPAARLVFLTLCNWRSLIPQLALEAVTLRASNERIDVEQTIEELRRSSFVEVSESEDGEVFVSVPLVASVFGMRKLLVSPMKTSVEANTEVLLLFGAAQKADIRKGIGPRIQRLFSTISNVVAKDPTKLSDYLPMLEFISQRYYPAWLLLASLHEETDFLDAFQKSKECVRRYLERENDVELKRLAWERLASICRQTNDPVEELHALVEMCSLPDPPFLLLSNTINRWNGVFKQQHLNLAGDERQILGSRLLDLAKKDLDQASPTDCSRIAWLALALHDDEQRSLRRLEA